MPSLHRFPINWQKCIEGIHLLADRQPGITPFYVSKIFFFADKQHLLDWGRPVSGDRYIAMENGPVPSGVYDIIKKNEFLADTLLDEFDNRIRKQGRRLYPRYPFQECALSRSDIQALEEALSRYSSMSFGALSHLSHQEPSWQDAWEKSGISNEMDPLLLIDETVEERDELIEEIKQKTKHTV